MARFRPAQTKIIDSSFWMQTVGATLFAGKWCSTMRVWMSAQNRCGAHGLLYLAAVRDDWREQEHRQGIVDTDPLLVSYRHAVG